MADDSKFYWIKLRTDFFADDSPMDFLLGQKNGSEYVALYIKLCLATANTGGRMCSQYGECIVPFDAEKIQRDMKFFSIDTIRIALGLYKAIGLIYEEEDGVLAIANHESMVGSETRYAEKMRKYREGVKARETAGYIVAQDVAENVGYDVRQEIRDKEIRDIEIIEQIPEKETKKKESARALFTRLLQDYCFSESVEEKILEWISYKSERKENYKETGAKSLLSQIQNKIFEYGESDVLELIDECMANNWKGIIWDKLSKAKPKKTTSLVDEWMNA